MLLCPLTQGPVVSEEQWKCWHSLSCSVSVLPLFTLPTSPVSLKAFHLEKIKRQRPSLKIFEVLDPNRRAKIILSLSKRHEKGIFSSRTLLSNMVATTDYLHLIKMKNSVSQSQLPHFKRSIAAFWTAQIY